jgi:V8-like Glu-specific endopeptidase
VPASSIKGDAWQGRDRRHMWLPAVLVVSIGVIAVALATHKASSPVAGSPLHPAANDLHSLRATTTTTTTMRNAVAFAGSPAVGALFVANDGHPLSHFCTASVINSPAGNLVLTAAHCLVTGTSNLVFVPGYHDGKAPYGIWDVTRTVVNQAWSTSGNPNDDFAFLVIAQHGHTTLQDVTGAENLCECDAAGDQVLVEGYPDSSEDPISCQAQARSYSSTQFQFDCGGYADGTSGSPLLVNASTGHGTVVGVIGGFEQGGNLPQVSYAARFEANMASLYKVAIGVSARSTAKG